MSKSIAKAAFIALLGTSNYIYAEDYDFKPGIWTITGTVKTIKIEHATPEEEKRIRDMSEHEESDTSTICARSSKELFLYGMDEDEDVTLKRKRVDAHKETFTLSRKDWKGKEILSYVGEHQFNGTTAQQEMTVITTASTNNIKVTSKAKLQAKLIEPQTCD